MTRIVEKSGHDRCHCTTERHEEIATTSAIWVDDVVIEWSKTCWTLIRAEFLHDQQRSDARLVVRDRKGLYEKVLAGGDFGKSKVGGRQLSAPLNAGDEVVLQWRAYGTTAFSRSSSLRIVEGHEVE